jgi:hypothetical protein
VHKKHKKASTEGVFFVLNFQIHKIKNFKGVKNCEKFSKNHGKRVIFSGIKIH